jgi:hypothetical protein
VSAVRIGRVTAQTHTNTHVRTSVPPRTFWTASCRRCGRRLLEASPDRRKLKRQAEAAIATHDCSRVTERELRREVV